MEAGLNPSFLTPLFSSVPSRRSSQARDAPPPLAPLMRGRMGILGRRTRHPRTALAAGLVRVAGAACCSSAPSRARAGRRLASHAPERVPGAPRAQRWWGGGRPRDPVRPPPGAPVALCVGGSAGA